MQARLDAHADRLSDVLHALAGAEERRAGDELPAPARARAVSVVRAASARSAKPACICAPGDPLCSCL